MPSLKKLNLKHLHSFFFAPKQAFTLVELIVVISVLGVLATIAFTQVSNVTQSARNSTRMTNIQSISSSLNIYKATNWTYQIPDNKTDILYSGTTIGYQGYIKDTAARLLKLSPSSSQDPLNTSTYFSYATNASRTNMQILGFLEANTTSFKVLPATFASDELNTKTPYSKGEELGMLYTSGTTTPLTGTSIELNTLTNPYTAYYNSTDSLSGTWNLLQNLVISYAHGSGFGSPSNDSCPTGFIPVPGNKDFNQPGFCVAKYEMKQAVGDAGSYSRSWASWVSDGNRITPYCSDIAPCAGTGVSNFSQSILSKAEGYPIAHINQYQAIEACKAMGTGYHLITNNEWMAIARNIEQTNSNWSTNTVGSGYLYSGHNDLWPAHVLDATINDNDWYYKTNDNNTSDDGIFNYYSSNLPQANKWQKRTLTLANGQVIWDFAGNVSEHVNKANNLNGQNYNSSTFFPSDACGWSGWYSFSAGDGVSQCGFMGGYLYTNIWPLSLWLNANNGVGHIRTYTTANNIFFRWGDCFYGFDTWIYAINLSWFDSSNNAIVWFRCAK